MHCHQIFRFYCCSLVFKWKNTPKKEFCPGCYIFNPFAMEVKKICDSFSCWDLKWNVYDTRFQAKVFKVGMDRGADSYA